MLGHGTEAKIKALEIANKKLNVTSSSGSSIIATTTTTTITTTTVTKRDAFGELQNRAILRAITGPQPKDLKDSQAKAGICNGRASVVTAQRKLIGRKRAPCGSVVGNVMTRSKTACLLKASTTTTASDASAAILGAKLVTKKLQEMKLTKKSKAPMLTELASMACSIAASCSSTTAPDKENIPCENLEKLNIMAKVNAAGITAMGGTDNTAKPQLDTSITNEPTTAAVAQHSPATAVAASDNAIIDIDAGDGHNLYLVSTYVNEIYSYMYEVEARQCIRPNHLLGQTEITPHMRAILVDWISDVQAQFHLTLEVFQKSVAIIDLYLQVVPNTTRKNLQLVGVTALFIATKYEELLPPSVKDFTFVTDDAYTAKEICQMEMQILKTLDYNLERPVAIQFLRRYSKAANANGSQHTLAKYFLELAALAYELAACKPSLIAAAALFLALQLLSGSADKPTGWNDALWTPTLRHYARYTPAELRPVAKHMAKIARHVPNGKLKASFQKYASSKMYNSALCIELYGPLMDSIINASG